MKKIKYITGDLFSAKKDSILVHAVNCKGVMGGGIAAVFKKYFPRMFLVYKNICDSYKENFLGKCYIYIDPQCYVVNLATSNGFGSEVDSPEEILKSTDLAIENMFSKLREMPLLSKNICSNKFNSGLFNVPWEDTEKIILKHLNDPLNAEFNWIVYEYEEK